MLSIFLSANDHKENKKKFDAICFEWDNVIEVSVFSRPVILV